jgi:hypothetical protein
MILLAREALQHADHGMDLHRAHHLPQRDAGHHQHQQAGGPLVGSGRSQTGYTRKAGFNIVATAKDGDRRLIVVVLGSPQSRIRDAFATAKFIEYLVARPATQFDTVEPDELWIPGVEIHPAEQVDPAELTATGVRRWTRRVHRPCNRLHHLIRRVKSP